jgi:hypothetical protein
MAYFELHNPRQFKLVNMPLGGLEGNPEREILEAEKNAENIFTYFDQYIPVNVVGDSDVVLLDYVYYGRGTRFVSHFLVKYFQERAKLPSAAALKKVKIFGMLSQHSNLGYFDIESDTSNKKEQLTVLDSTKSTAEVKELVWLMDQKIAKEKLLLTMYGAVKGYAVVKGAPVPKPVVQVGNYQRLLARIRLLEAIAQDK